MTWLSLASFFLRRAARGGLSSLTLYVTDRCDLACRTCFVPRQGREPDLAFFARLAAQVPPLLWLDIGGGEPFLRHDLARICALFRTQVLAVPTNGQAPDAVAEAVRDIRASTTASLVVSISLDGPREVHEAIRGEGTWDRAWETFRLLRAMRGVSLKVNTVMCASSVDLMPEFAGFVRSQGPDGHSLIVLRGSPRDPSLAPPTPAQLRRIASPVLRVLATYPYHPSSLIRPLLSGYHRFLWEVTIATLEQRRQVVPCLAGRAHAVVWPDETMGPCELLEPVGPLTSGVQNLMQSQAWRHRRRLIAKGGCWCTHNCALLVSGLSHVPSLLRIVAHAVKRP